MTGFVGGEGRSSVGVDTAMLGEPWPPDRGEPALLLARGDPELLLARGDPALLERGDDAFVSTDSLGDAIGLVGFTFFKSDKLMRLA